MYQPCAKQYLICFRSTKFDFLFSYFRSHRDVRHIHKLEVGVFTVIYILGVKGNINIVAAERLYTSFQCMVSHYSYIFRYE